MPFPIYSLFNLTAMKEYSTLLKLGGPVLVTQLGVIFVSFADTMMIGAYGTDELAASAFVNSLFVVVAVMLMAFAGGITPLIGSLYTQKKHFEAGRTLRASLQINIALAAAMTLLMGILFFFLHLFEPPQELMFLIREYYLIILLSIIPMSIFSCCQQMANGTTDTLSPMIIMISANVLNVVGNYLLIFGKCGLPEMGIVGAGISTLISRVAGCIAMAWVVRGHGRYRPYRKGMLTGGGLGHLRYRVWVTSYPVMIQGGIECMLWTYGTIVVGWFGKIELAAYQVVNTISQLGFMTYMSFATATSIRVANKMGEKDLPGIRATVKAGLTLNCVLATIASSIFFFFSHQIIPLFTSDQAVIDAALPLIIPLVLYQFGDAFQYTYANAQRGTAVVKPLAYVSVISYVVIGMPTLYTLGVTAGLEIVGVFYSFSVALFAASAMLIWWFYHTLKEKKVQFEAAATV